VLVSGDIWEAGTRSPVFCRRVDLYVGSSQHSSLKKMFTKSLIIWRAWLLGTGRLARRIQSLQRTGSVVLWNLLLRLLYEFAHNNFLPKFVQFCIVFVTLDGGPRCRGRRVARGRCTWRLYGNCGICTIH